LEKNKILLTFQWSVCHSNKFTVTSITKH